MASIPNTDVVDWVLIELRDAPDAVSATPATMIGRLAAFVSKDGSIVDMDGVSNPYFPHAPIPQLFVVIWHRNHLGIMSAYPLTEISGIYNYDFTTGADEAYGGANGHKEIGTGIWGMRGGDGNSDGDINNLDKNDIWLPDYGNTGYLNGDFNMDSQVLDDDKIDIWQPNSGKGTQVL
ncbi:MAG: hypothetical protein H8D45_26750 [Bacteroidetes bacterium]|nr:hypothetical protein [Bacteroidota bacterium]MBL7104015.1 hypothetical protein [Bacteroidales bacterium]